MESESREHAACKKVRTLKFSFRLSQKFLCRLSFLSSHQLSSSFDKDFSCATITAHFLNEDTLSIGSGVASQTIQSRYANFKLLSLFIALEIDCFHGQ